MNRAKLIFLTLFSINALAVLLTLLNGAVVEKNIVNTIDITKLSGPMKTYEFDDTLAAYYILDALDVDSVVGEPLKGNYNAYASGFKQNDNYCKQHRAYFVYNPQDIFTNKNFITNYWGENKIRNQVMRVIGEDLHPTVNPANIAKLNGTSVHDMRVDGNMFFTNNLFYYRRQVGKQFSCLTQTSNHIPGHDKMYRKDRVGQALVDYASKYTDRSHCFNYEKYFPKTWLLQDQKQCKEFFKEFNSQEYKKMREERNIVYFRKIGANVHEGQGVFPVSIAEEGKIRQTYKNGALCGTVKANNLIQYNVYNPLLINNRKFGFRMFLLVASSNPVIAFYHDGYLRLSLDEYNPKSKDIRTFVTNIGVNLKEAAEDKNLKKLTNKEIQEKTTWFLEDLQTYLLEKGIIADPEWLDNYMRPEFKKVMVHLIRMSQSTFQKKSSLFELFGLDFVMDEDLGLWFIEANTMPLIDGFTDGSTKLMNRMLEDTFEIVFGLLRSRTKRIIDYLNLVVKEVKSFKNAEGKFELRNLADKRIVYNELIENRFEPEFVPSPDNTWQMIIDENQSGTQRYMNLIDEQCL